MSNHFTGLSLGPPLGDQRLDLCDLYAFQSPADKNRTAIILNANAPKLSMLSRIHFFQCEHRASAAYIGIAASDDPRVETMAGEGSPHVLWARS